MKRLAFYIPYSMNMLLEIYRKLFLSLKTTTSKSTSISDDIEKSIFRAAKSRNYERTAELFG